MASHPARPAWLRGETPLIGMVHLAPLPGSPRYAGSMQGILDCALRDARILAEEGIATLLVENFGDAPFYPDSVPPETVAAMASILSGLRSGTPPELAWGVNVLRNDARAAVAVAAAAGASFIRVNVHTGAAWTDQGLVQGRAWETARLRAAVAPDLAVLADVRVKHSRPAAERPLAEEVRDLVERGLADALLVTGARTGEPPDLEELETVVSAAEGVPVLVASGVDHASIGGYLDRCRGVLVGTSVKRDGITTGPVDRMKVRRLVKAAGAGRSRARGGRRVP